MGKRAILAIAGVLLLIAACRNSTGPPGGISLPDGVAMLASVAGDDGSSVEPHILEQADSAPSLVAYAASFWVVGNQSRHLSINYVTGLSVHGGDKHDDDDDGDKHDDDDDDDDDDDVRDDVGDATFLSLYIPGGAIHRLPNGERLGKRDSVQITITIDPRLLSIALEPSGLTFHDSKPAQLYVSYAGANGDYNNDGVQDATDAWIEQNYLGIWVREAQGDPWFTVVGDHSVTERWFLGYLRHFSDHAVSW